MFSGPDDHGQRQEIQTSLKSILETSESWLKRLRRRQWEVRLASAFLTAFFVFFGTLIVDAVSILFAQGVIGPSAPKNVSNTFNIFMQQHPNILFSIVGPAFLTAPIAAIVVYFLLRWRHEARLRELSSLVAKMKKKVQEGERPQSSPLASSEGIAEDALTLADQVLTLLPGLVRKRNTDSLVFGVVAFILALIIGQNAAVGVLVGVIVWIYFRYETRKTYDQELAKLEQQRRIFEQRKNDFLETL